MRSSETDSESDNEMLGEKSTEQFYKDLEKDPNFELGRGNQEKDKKDDEQDMIEGAKEDFSEERDDSEQFYRYQYKAKQSKDEILEVVGEQSDKEEEDGEEHEVQGAHEAEEAEEAEEGLRRRL